MEKTIDGTVRALRELAHMHDDYGGEMCEIAADMIESLMEKAKGISLDRLEEICSAERDGRLAVLPCKEGVTVYGIRDSYVETGWGVVECSPYVVETTFEVGMTKTFGVSWFLTREAAEAAIAARKEQEK